MSRLPALSMLGLALLAGPLASSAHASNASAQRALSAPGRPAADLARDAMRKPAELLAFSGLKKGDRIGDLIPGQGYYTRLFSVVVGDQGKVYAIIPSELVQVQPKSLEVIKTLAAEPGMKNVTVLVPSTAGIAAPLPLDVAWTSDNYHDLYAFFGQEKAAQFDAAVFKALKPGGTFIVIDHVGPTGSDAAADRHLHRIDPEVVKAQVLAAGFKLEAQSSILANAADTHDQTVFSPAIRGRTDQFVFRFRKPD